MGVLLKICCIFHGTPFLKNTSGVLLLLLTYEISGNQSLNVKKLEFPGINGTNPECIQDLLVKNNKSEQRKNDLVILVSKSVTCGDKRSSVK